MNNDDLFELVYLENGKTVKRIKNQTPDGFMAAIKISGTFIQQVPAEHQTDALCLEAVKNNWMALEYVIDQTDEMCMIALEKSDGYALQYIHRQTEQMCIKAVQYNGWHLQNVKKQTPAVCIAALTKNPLVVEYVDKNILKHIKFVYDPST